MRIEVGTLKETAAKKETVKETLAIGKRLPERGQVYARILGDEGVFKLNAKLLGRSKALCSIPARFAAAILRTSIPKRLMRSRSRKTRKPSPYCIPKVKPWEVQVGSAAPRKANNQAIERFFDRRTRQRGKSRGFTTAPISKSSTRR